jgi:hypothetical protein
MALFGLFKSNEEKKLDAALKHMFFKLFPNGEEDLIRDCTKVNQITNGKIPPDLLKSFVAGCKSLLFVSSDDQDEARFVESYIRRAQGLITEKEARYIYVYFIGHARHLDRMAQHLKEKGLPLTIELLAELKDMARAYDAGIDADELPTGIGPFGLVLSNPIPTVSIKSSNHYLSKLRFNGQPVVNNRLGSKSSDVTLGMIDCYSLSIENKVIGTIYICPYHKKNSTKVPSGFTLA